MWHARTGESEESWSQGQGGQAGAAPGPGECGAGVRGAATRPGAARRSPSPARSEFTDALLDQLKVLGDPESVPSAFQAEVATSVVLGNVTGAGTKQGIKPETTRELLVEAIRHMVAGLERRTPPCAYPVLRALTALAPPEVRPRPAARRDPPPAPLRPRLRTRRRISSRHRRRRSCGTRSRARCRTCWPCAASGTSGASRY